MDNTYYRIWVGKVISLCWLAVVAQQAVRVVRRPDGCAELLFEHRVTWVVRRPWSEAEATAYEKGRARVLGYVRVVLWAGLLGWAVVSVASGRAGTASWAPAVPGLVVAAVAGPGLAPAAWQELDPGWAEHLAAGEQVLWVTNNRTQLGALRRLWQLSMWCVLLCVRTSQRTLLYVRPDQRQTAWRRCPACGQVAVGYKDDHGYEAVRDYPLLGERVYLLVHKRRYHCRNSECEQKTFTARGDLVAEHRRLTERFRSGLQEQIVDMDLKTNAQVLDIGYGQIRALEAELMAQAERVAWYEETLLREAKELHVGLDEHSQHRRHKYVSVLYEKTFKKLLDMCQGRKKDDLAKMLGTIPAEMAAKIKTVTIDRSRQMLGAVQEVLAHATIIVDKFHLIRDVGKVAQTVRKRLKRAESQKIEAEYRRKTKGLSKSEQRKVKRRANIYSQVRYALLRPRSYWNNPKDNQEPKQKKAEEYARLQQALAKSQELKKAYDLLTEFRDLFDNRQLDRTQAEAALTAWYKKAKASRLRGFKSLVKSFQEWNEYILNYFAYAERYTNAAVEGLNNKCKRVQRQGYGVSKFAHYKHRCQRAVNGGFIGLGSAAENPADNFVDSSHPAGARATGVKSGRGRKKAA